MPLTNVSARAAIPRDKSYRIADGNGMYLEVMPTGAKYWRMKFRIAGKEKRLAFGVYPEVSLAEARSRRDEACKLLAMGRDPSLARRANKLAGTTKAANSFEVIAREWLEKFSTHWVPSHADRIVRRLERDIFPWLGDRPIAEVTSPELLSVLRRIENRGALETAHRAHQNCGQIFRYAVATGRAARDPGYDLKGALPPVKEKHHATITGPKAIGELLRAIEGYEGSLVTKSALRLAPLVFVRPGELRKAEWSEFNLDIAEWRIPAARMKMRAQHIVPLSSNAVAVLRELHALTGSGHYVFPGERSKKRPMSENTVNAALRRLGYSVEQMTGHGFRSMASTLLNEHGWHRDAIERQLAHAERDSVRAAYNYAEHLHERRKMMQHWADYLNALKVGAAVIPLHRLAS